MSEDLNIIEEELINFCAAISEAAQKLQVSLEKIFGIKWNPDKIKWEKTQGFKGEYERSDDVNNLEFKKMLRDLALHDNHLTRDGWFYWVFKNGSTVGRRKRD